MMYCGWHWILNSAIPEWPCIVTVLIWIMFLSHLENQNYFIVLTRWVLSVATINHSLFEETSLCDFGFLSVQVTEYASILWSYGLCCVTIKLKGKIGKKSVCKTSRLRFWEKLREAIKVHQKHQKVDRKRRWKTIKK